MADKILYATGINGKPIAASAIVPESALAKQISDMQGEIDTLESIGAFEVVNLTSGADPVPDVAEPSTKVIYLTKEAGSAKTDPYTEWIWIAADATKVPPVTAHWEVIGETSLDLSGYKTKQTAVDVTGGTLKGVASMSQNENGEVTLTLNDIQDGTTSQKGVVQLEDSYASTSTTKAATPAAVKAAYDLANGKYSLPSGGIPSTDMASAVQTSLGKADTALQPVSGAASGNFVGFGSNGAIQDSGSKAADFATAAQGTKADSAVQGVTMNGTDVVDSTTKIAAIPAATTPTPSDSGETTGAYGVVQITLMEI